MSMTINDISARAAQEAAALAALRAEIGKVIVGQETVVDRLLLALLCNGHVLLEGVPGLAKTLTITTLAKCLDAVFHRIQFTPDLLPADVIGTQVYNPASGEFRVRKGPVFANLILADEINRAPAKVQSALLEAMQERQVTIGDEAFPMADPFLVLATQNPVEQEGTYPLPEAQVDRFMFKLKVTYPEKGDELKILRRMAGQAPIPEVAPVMSPADIIRLRALAMEVHVDPRIEEYIVNLVDATRRPQAYGLDSLRGWLQYGASPRATIFLTQAAKGNALLGGRGYVTPQDVKSIAMDVLRHRLLLTYEAEAEEKTPEELVQAILDTVKVP